MLSRLTRKLQNTKYYFLYAYLYFVLSSHTVLPYLIQKPPLGFCLRTELFPEWENKCKATSL